MLRSRARGLRHGTGSRGDQKSRLEPTPWAVTARNPPTPSTQMFHLSAARGQTGAGTRQERDSGGRPRLVEGGRKANPARRTLQSWALMPGPISSKPAFLSSVFLTPWRLGPCRRLDICPSTGKSLLTAQTGLEDNCQTQTSPHRALTCLPGLLLSSRDPPALASPGTAPAPQYPD